MMDERRVLAFTARTRERCWNDDGNSGKSTTPNRPVTSVMRFGIMEPRLEPLLMSLMSPRAYGPCKA